VGGVAVKTHRFAGKVGEGCEYTEASLLCAKSKDAAIHFRSNPLQPVIENLRVAFPTFSNEAAGEAVSAFTAHADAVLALVREKDKAYGGAWQKQGYMGNLARILSKAERLKNMCWTDSEGITVDPDDESVMDTLHDLMALCAFMASNIEEGNRWGR
jgi:hypothetical protein